MTEIAQRQDSLGSVEISKKVELKSISFSTSFSLTTFEFLMDRAAVLNRIQEGGLNSLLKPVLIEFCQILSIKTSAKETKAILILALSKAHEEEMSTGFSPPSLPSPSLPSLPSLRRLSSYRSLQTVEQHLPLESPSLPITAADISVQSIQSYDSLDDAFNAFPTFSNLAANEFDSPQVKTSPLRYSKPSTQSAAATPRFKGTTTIGKLTGGLAEASSSFIFGSPMATKGSFTFAMPSPGIVASSSSKEAILNELNEKMEEQKEQPKRKSSLFRSLSSAALNLLGRSPEKKEKKSAVEKTHQKLFDGMASITDHYAAKRSAPVESTTRVESNRPVKKVKTDIAPIDAQRKVAQAKFRRNEAAKPATTRPILAARPPPTIAPRPVATKKAVSSSSSFGTSSARFAPTVIPASFDCISSLAGKAKKPKKAVYDHKASLIASKATKKSYVKKGSLPVSFEPTATAVLGSRRVSTRVANVDLLKPVKAAK